MKKLNVRFERDENANDIDIIIRAREQDEQIRALIESLTKFEAAKPETLTLLDSENRVSIVEEKDIVLVSADGKRTSVTTTSGIFRAKQSLQGIERLLSRDFLRVSRFEIVNLKMVVKFDFTIGGTLRIEFKNGMETWASRRYIPQIRERLSGEEGYLC